MNRPFLTPSQMVALHYARGPLARMPVIPVVRPIKRHVKEPAK